MCGPNRLSQSATVWPPSMVEASRPAGPPWPQHFDLTRRAASAYVNPLATSHNAWATSDTVHSPPGNAGEP